MRGHSAVVSTLINLAVIFFIFKAVMKAANKHKQNKPGTPEDETVYPGKTGPDAGRPIHQSRPEQPRMQPPRQNIFDRPQPQVRKVRFETKPVFNDNLQLKRCPHCGGEIPVMMMKCEICGHRQTGCSTALWVLIAAVAGIIVALIAGSDQSWAAIFGQIGQWLGQLN
jgi:hypothetical protein